MICPYVYLALYRSEQITCFFGCNHNQSIMIRGRVPATRSLLSNKTLLWLTSFCITFFQWIHGLSKDAHKWLSMLLDYCSSLLFIFLWRIFFDLTLPHSRTPLITLNSLHFYPKFQVCYLYYWLPDFLACIVYHIIKVVYPRAYRSVSASEVALFHLPMIASIFSIATYLIQLVPGGNFYRPLNYHQFCVSIMYYQLPRNAVSSPTFILQWRSWYCGTVS